MDPNKPQNLLKDISRQPILIGNPPIYLFNQEGQKLDRELINLSAQLRIADALEALVKLKEQEGSQSNG